MLGALVVTLSACGHKPKGSVAEGDCKAFEPPRYEVKGKAQYDQDWIDGNIEAGVGACNWDRPGARPPELDAPVVARRPPVVVAPPQKKTLRERLHLKKRKPGVVTSQVPRGRPFDLGETIVPSANAAPAVVEPEPPAVITQPAPPAAREEDALDDASTTDAILGTRVKPKAPCAWWQRNC